MQGLQFRKKRRAHLPMIFQEESMECGQACVAMISNYWGHELDLVYLRRILSVCSQGSHLASLKNLFEKLGFKTRAIKVPINELMYVRCPAILHWNMNHFIVLKKVTKGAIIIHDPAEGIKKLTLTEAASLFTGIVLEVDTILDFKKISVHQPLTLKTLIKNIAGINSAILLLFLISLMIEIFNLANPLFIQFITDQVIASNDTANLYAGVLGFGLLIILQVFTEFIRNNMIIFLSNNLTAQFSAYIVQHLLKLPLHFFLKRHKGDLQSKFQSIDFIQRKMSVDFINALLDGLMIILSIGIMSLYSVLLTLLVLISLSIYLLIRALSYNVLKKYTEQSIVEQAHTHSLFLEALQGITSIKSFLKENFYFNVWQKGYIKSLNANIKAQHLNVNYNIFNQLLSQSEQLIILCIGAVCVMQHKLSLGMLIAFLSFRLTLVNKALNFIQNGFDYKLLSIQLNRLSDILFHEPENINEGIGNTTPVEGRLSLHQGSFKHHMSLPWIFQDLDLTINAGEKVVITGPSGCGKTTLLKVLMGLLEPTDGKVLIDGIDLKKFGLKNYRTIIASVMQEDTLLSGSIIDNIAFFDEEIDLEKVYEAATHAAVHKEIEQFTMGYDTLIGDMGSTLSGGQKQRILLARALYKKPIFLFLDEATSHLDQAKEIEINNALKGLKITQIIVAHREETIRMGDRVITLA